MIWSAPMLEMAERGGDGGAESVDGCIIWLLTTAWRTTADLHG